MNRYALKNSPPLALFLVSSALLLAGCGSDDPEASSGTGVIGNPNPSGGGGGVEIPCPDGRALVGSGTPASPYEIACIEQLSIIRPDPAPGLAQTHYLLVSDLDFSNVVTTASIIPQFNGVFDGGSRSIRNLSLRGESFVGFFGLLEEKANIKDLVLDGVSAEGSEHVGSLAGFMSGAVVTGVSVLNASVKGEEHAGGLIGQIASLPGQVEGCKAQGVTVRGKTSIGGLIGRADTPSAQGVSIIKSSSSDGEVFGAHQVGGLIGDSSVMITDCFSAATVTGEPTSNEVGPAILGGLVGHQRGVIERSHATGGVKNVFNGANVGGLVGALDGSIIDSYAEGDIEEGSVQVGGLVGGAFRDPNSPRSILRSYATGSVAGKSRVGGLVGTIGSEFEETDFATIGLFVKQSYARGSVTASDPDGDTNVLDGAGGLVGWIEGGAAIEESYAAGAVSGSLGQIGGLVGFQERGAVARSFSASKVAGVAPIGGLIGELADGAEMPELSFWDVDASGVSACVGKSSKPSSSCSGVNAGGSAPSYFFSAASPPLNQWDFVNVWLEQPGDYPIFKPAP